MFGLGPATKIYIAVEAVDMRKGLELTRYLTYNRTYSWLPSILNRAS